MFKRVKEKAVNTDDVNRRQLFKTLDKDNQCTVKKLCAFAASEEESPGHSMIHNIAKTFQDGESTHSRVDKVNTMVFGY
jgi:hypothetical protein